MPPSTRIPPLLQPYIHLPHGDPVLLLTSTLGASANWLLIRFLCDALSNSTDSGDDEHNVVLVSWMREYEFWKQEARKGAGLDLERLRREGRFAFVDGLSGLCLESSSDAQNGVVESRQAPGVNGGRISSPRGPQSLPVRGLPAGRIVPARGPPAQGVSAPQRDIAPSTPTEPSASKATPGLHTLQSLDLALLKATISTAVSTLASSTNPRKTLLVLDNPDTFLALSPTTTPTALTSLILALHTLPTISHILVHVQSDTPLISLSTPPQPLEVAQHNLLVKVAHMSRRIFGMRVLDTGVARDVSGVVRVTEQSVGWMDLGLESGEKVAEESSRGKEFLYQVKGDGGVRVFERGAGGEG